MPNSKIIKHIINMIEMTPSIKSFSYIDPTNNDSIKTESEIEKNSIMILRENNNIEIKIAIILSINSNFKNTTKQLKESISFGLSQNSLTLKKLTILIKGVK